MKANGLARIGKDAEVRYTPGGAAVANVSLAFTYGKKGDDGKRPTLWVDASLWGQRAESLAPYIKKGGQIVAYLEDVSIQTFTKGDGTQATKMVARLVDLEFVAGGEQASSQPKPQPKPQAAPQSHGSGFDDMDDDIPFN
jgi:single-strand DNA-binding protein